MRPAHFYHLWAAGDWRPAAVGHAGALEAAALRPELYVGLVGDEAERAAAREWLDARLPGWIIAAEADYGFEEVTLRALRAWAAGQPPFRPVLYAHTKGALNPWPLNTAWRESMTRHVVGRWLDCMDLLSAGHDTAGCHWITPDAFPERNITASFYGGNFWWARCGYVAGLPEPSRRDRHDAETWIGLGSPSAADLLPGWPSGDLFEAGILA